MDVYKDTQLKDLNICRLRRSVVLRGCLVLFNVQYASLS